jgi:hypothetical protein
MMPGLTSPQETSVLCMAGILGQMTALAQSPLLGGQRLGGPGSSSDPGSRSHLLQPSAAMDLTLAAPIAAQRAVPAPLMPSKWTQCQQGRRSLRQGLK